MDYHTKYLKYKKKYLELKGGSNNNQVTPAIPPTPTILATPAPTINPNNIVTPNGNNNPNPNITIRGRIYNIEELMNHYISGSNILPGTQSIMTDAEIERLTDAYTNFVSH